MNNSLTEVHPELVSEWSEKNLPLKPDEVNAKSRKNVWWRCGKCGNEWKSVINARVKGTVCPVCAERKVLAGYNDLATTDRPLLSEWDYEQNKLKPICVYFFSIAPKRLNIFIHMAVTKHVW